MSRMMSDTGSVIIIQTRWHEDDLAGRLTDPSNPCYNEDEAKLWKIINLPAVAEADDVLGRGPGAPLWPDPFGPDYLDGFRRRNPRGFSAHYTQRPTPQAGAFVKSAMVLPSKSAEQTPS